METFYRIVRDNKPEDFGSDLTYLKPSNLNWTPHTETYGKPSEDFIFFNVLKVKMIFKALFKDHSKYIYYIQTIES